MEKFSPINSFPATAPMRRSLEGGAGTLEVLIFQQSKEQ